MRSPGSVKQTNFRIRTINIYHFVIFYRRPISIYSIANLSLSLNVVGFILKMENL